MSRPLGEKGPHDRIAGGAYGVRQLERRPTTVSVLPWSYIRGQTVSITTGIASYKNLFDNSLGTITGDTSDTGTLEPIMTSTSTNGIDFKAAGIYLLDLMLTWTTGFTTTIDYRIRWSNTVLFPSSGLFGQVNEGSRITNANGVYNKAHMLFTDDTSGTFKADALQDSGTTRTIDEALLKVTLLPAILA